MSHAALQTAVKNFIQKNLQYREFELRDMSVWNAPDGRPMPGSGEFTISVHAGGFRGLSPEYLETEHTINVTMTLKVGRVPVDKMGVEGIVNLTYGLDEIADWLADNIHDNYDIMTDANNIILEHYYKTKKIRFLNTYVEPLRFNNSSPARIVTGEWFHGQSTNSGEVGLVQSVVFTEAKRVKLSARQPTVTDF